jgi:D-glycero-D-manno-heptose 1,7-bisphosphate phosphatase
MTVDALRPVAFLDRDGTINVDCHYLSDPDQMELIPGAAVAMRNLRDAGYALVVITNQSGIGRGYFDMDRLGEIHNRFHQLLADEDVAVDGIYICPHAPSDDCVCRKPLPYLAEKAAAELGLDLSRSVMVGDKMADVGLGKAIGATAILVRTGYGLKEEANAGPHADYVADDLQDAVNWLLSKR